MLNRSSGQGVHLNGEQMFEQENAHNLERIADALEVYGNLYLVYLYAAFGAEHIDMLIDTITEGETE